MKIVMFCDAFFEDLHYQENLLVKYYLKHGHDIVVFSGVWENVNKYYNNEYNRNLPETIEVIDRLKLIKLHYIFQFTRGLRFFKNLTSILNEEKPDLIYVHDIHFNLHNAVAYKKNNPSCRLILDFHADFSNSANSILSLLILHKVIRKLYLRSNLKYIDKIFPIIPSSAFFLKKVYGIDDSMMEILPLGVDTDLVNEFKQNNLRAKLRADLNIKSNDIVIISAGKFGSWKKTDQLINAFKTIDNPSIHLLLVGGPDHSDPDFFKHLESLIYTDHRIKYLGWKDGDTVVSYLIASDIAVFPASQSVLWQESIGAGLAVLIGRYSNSKKGVLAQDVDYLNKRGNILILEEKIDKTEEIKKNIIDLIENQQKLNYMKSASIKVTNEFLSYDLIVKQTIGC